LTGSTAQAKGAWVQVTVQRASPDNPAPICILTDLPTTDIVVVPAGPGGEIHRRWPGDNPFGIDLEGGDGEGPEGEEPWDGTRRPEEALEPWEIRSRRRGDNPFGIDLGGGAGGSTESEEPIEIPPTGIARTGPQDPDFLGSGVQEPDQDDDVFPPRGSS
jgi:hypothetical protein